MASDNDGVYVDVGKDDAQWTLDEDGAICKLKKDGKTWANIGKAINRSKSDVQKRFKHIKICMEAAGHDPNVIGESWAEDMRRAGREIPSPDKPSPAKNQTTPLSHAPPSPEVVEIVSLEEPASESVRERGGASKNTHKKKQPQQHERPESPKLTVATKVVKKGGKKFLTFESPMIPLPETSSESSSSSSSSGEETDSEEERAAHKSFIYHEYLSELYPDQKTYMPDKFWTANDCKTLAVIEAKYEALKHKHIQAEFFNATGRMISTEIIKHKLEQGTGK
ncbi:hypothetical protein JX265_012709 [Neoarthrinium moseri]|uniref:Myb-like domain-containing protein n=1 Tax=Neoarthrinium moseri TaxID=1658444 RepID=A0A9P9WA02_9PEZI|nr:hypothetical protein JX265_012709 [Neoarthrinium moseri]